MIWTRFFMDMKHEESPAWRAFQTARSAGPAGLLLLAFLGGCGDKIEPIGYLHPNSGDIANDELIYSTTPGHTNYYMGSWHKPGADDPFVNCLSCHGAGLKGAAGPNCYECHDNSDHEVNRLGTMHNVGANSACTRCHGPNNKGGIGTSCAVCHGKTEPGTGATGHTENHDGIMHKAGGSTPLANCTSCHGAKLRGGIGSSCYSCHNNSDHTKNRDGARHRSGTNPSCNKCHGPGNSGGLGPKCSKCHDSNNPSDDD